MAACIACGPGFLSCRPGGGPAGARPRPGCRERRGGAGAAGAGRRARACRDACRRVLGGRGARAGGGRVPGAGRGPVAGQDGGGSPGTGAGYSSPAGVPQASRSREITAVVSASPRWNSRMPSRDRSADVMAPSAATWQVAPGGQSPSRIPATPALWPACSTAASRALAARAGDAISAAAGSGGAAGSPGGSSPVSQEPDMRARRTMRASAWSRAASREGVMIRPGRPAPLRSSRWWPGSSRAVSAAGMITSAGPPGWPGTARASRPARIARAAAGAPGPVRPRPPRAAMSAQTSLPPRTPRAITPGGCGPPGGAGGACGRLAGAVVAPASPAASRKAGRVIRPGSWPAK